MARVTFAGEKMDFGAHPGMANPAPSGVTGTAREVGLTSKNNAAFESNNNNNIHTDNTRTTTTAGAAASATAAPNNLSCNTCREAFSSIEELRKHFGSELHIRNIRARVEGVATMDRTEYRRSFGASGASGFSRNGVRPSGAGGDPAFDGPAPMFTCNLCKRSYKSAQTLQSHLRSTEHLIKKEQKIIEKGSQAGSVISSMSLGSAAMGLHRRHKAHRHDGDRPKALKDENGNEIPVYESVLADDGETVIQRQVNRERPTVTAEDRETDVSPARCLFCGFKSSCTNKNLEHMLEFHDFTIPLRNHVKDIVALMEYVCKKINVCLCLVCAENTKKYETLEALRGHMRSANHERLILSPEYQEFFDCPLDDGKEANVEKIRDPNSGALVIVTASGSHICQREEGMLGGATHRNIRNESTVQREERKMLTAAKVEENALILRERFELMAPQLKEDLRIARQNLLRHAAHDMKKSIRRSKFHLKGYDGEGEVN